MDLRNDGRFSSLFSARRSLAGVWPALFLEFLNFTVCFSLVRKFFTVFVDPISFDTLLPYKQQQEQQQEQRQEQQEQQEEQQEEH